MDIFGILGRSSPAAREVPTPPDIPRRCRPGRGVIPEESRPSARERLIFGARSDPADPTTKLGRMDALLLENLRALDADVEGPPEIPEALADYIARLTPEDIERIRDDVEELERLGLLPKSPGTE